MTPHLGVHVLTEFMFCHRAGILAYEERRDDPGQELDAPPRLDYLPDFSVREIQDALQRTWTRIWAAALFSAVIGGLVVPPLLALNRVLTVVGLVILARPAFRWLARRFHDVIILQRRLRAAIEAPPDEPDPTLMSIQPVNWWSLRKAGFSVLNYEDGYTDDALKLSGRPWRVLQRGSLRIPVFRKRNGESALYPQHHVRMAAYCHLIESCEGAESPFGIVLFGETCEGLTVPNSLENRKAFLDALEAVRHVIQQVESGDHTPERPGSTVCSQCPAGRPRQFEEGRSETVLNGRPIQPHQTRGVDRRLYHSRCGDRFVWVPPHERAMRKKLR